MGRPQPAPAPGRRGPERPTGPSAPRRRRLPVLLRPDEVQALLRAASGPTALRDRALVALTFDAAMRVSEAVGALWPGVDWVKSRIRFARRKTGDEHEVTLTMSLPHLEAYRRSLGVVRPAGLIFPGRAGGLRPLTTRAAQLVMVRLCEWAGIPRGKARMHALRHGRATALLEAGCPLEAVRQHLGHSSAELTSSTYAHVADGWVAEQIRSASR